MISTDRKIFEEGSAVRERMIEYGELFDELHIIIFEQKVEGRKWKVEIEKNTFAYSTNSLSKFFYIFDAIRIGYSILNAKRYTLNAFVITTQDPFETGKVGVALKNKFGIPLNIQIHTDFLSPYFRRYSFYNRLRVQFAPYTLLKADSIRVVSERIRSSLLNAKRYTLQAPVTVLPIFVDREKLLAQPLTIDVKKSYPGFDKYLLWIGRLEKEKNALLALETVHELKKRGVRAALIMVGEGSERERLISRTKALELNDSVFFAGYQINLLSYYQTSDALLVTSLYEGFGLVILEAAYIGLPIISTDVGIAREIGAHLVESHPRSFAEVLSRPLQKRSYTIPPYIHSDKQEYLDNYKSILVKTIKK